MTATLSRNALILSVIFSARLAQAQTFSVLHNFIRPGAYPSAPLIRGRDGNYYGTTISGGDADKGTVFRFDSVGNVTILHSFLGSDGSAPQAGLIQAADGNFYGTTVNGGSGYAGTVFRIDPDGNLTTLHSFTNNNDGGGPSASLLQASDGNFYGTTISGGAATDFGTVFKMDSSGGVTILHSFTNGNDGGFPSACLTQAADGNLYGTTPSSIFKMDLEGNLTTLSANGSNVGLIQARDGDFYGTTPAGSTSSWGTVFKMDFSGRVTILHGFTNGNDGGSPSASLLQASDGDFYGTTGSGGSNNNGTVFRMDSSGNLTTLHGFNGGPDGSYPQAGLVQATDGSFYGTTEFGGGGAALGGEGAGTGEGTVFKVDSLGNLTTFRFAGTDGAIPRAGLILAADGNFYGTTTGGGIGNYGTIFKMDLSGNVTTLHSFVGSDGANPSASLIQASDGNFYGTTAWGGADNYGTVFRMDSSGNLTTLHSFAGTDGAIPRAGLIQATDGNFYGTTYRGGTIGDGSVFKMDAAGNVTTLHCFADGTDGAAPQASLIQATDGNFYGTTSGDNGSFNLGQSTIFRMDSSGNLTTLHVFMGGADGYAPLAGVIQGRDGAFYGTTFSGGASSIGTLFRMDSSGNLTILHSFTSGTDGGYPSASLVQASDGNYYGTTSDGGGRGGGTIFKIEVSRAGRRGDTSPLPSVPPAVISGR